MTEMTGRSLSPVEAPRPAPEGDRVADFRAKVRAAGQEWTGNEPDELVELLTKAAAGDPRLAAIVDAGGACCRTSSTDTSRKRPRMRRVIWQATSPTVIRCRRTCSKGSLLAT